MTTRDMGSLTSAILAAIPTSEELASLSDEQIETLRKYGNTYDNLLFLALRRRRETPVAQEQP